MIYFEANNVVRNNRDFNGKTTLSREQIQASFVNSVIYSSKRIRIKCLNPNYQQRIAKIKFILDFFLDQFYLPMIS